MPRRMPPSHACCAPSDVPESFERYSQERARDDVRAVMDALGIERAFVVGLSMGGFATLHFGMKYSPRALGLVSAGCGYGAEPAKREEFQRSSRDNAASRAPTAARRSPRRRKPS